MKIELIAIGNEVLAGFTVNSNAAFMSQQLLKNGFEVSSHRALPDDEFILKQELKKSIEENDWVICTGGLGPTCDDNTRTVAAEIFESDFYYNEEVAADLIRRYGGNLPVLLDQATVPRKAHLLSNKVGTAPGFVFKTGRGMLVLLPGVPLEMKPMLTEEAIPYLLKNAPIIESPFRDCFHFSALTEAAIDPLLRELKRLHPDVEFGIYPSQGTITVHLVVRAENEKEARKRLDGPKARLLEAFGERLFFAPSGKIEEGIHQLFIDKGLTLSVAESCTGGGLSSRLTHLSGASQFFLGGVVAYSNQMKQSLLGVDPAIIQKHGAVSEPVVQAMAQGILELTKSDYSLAVSGIAGPLGGSLEKPVGTIWAAIGMRGKKPHSWTFLTRGSRESIIERSIELILGELWMLVTRSIHK